MNLAIFSEALALGAICVLVGIVLHYLTVQIYGHHDLNSMSIFVVHLFVIGVGSHLLCEATGINKWYCTNGIACK
jgi:hypothetical protein